MTTSKEPTLIAGSGPCAERVAEQLTAVGTRLLVVTADSTFPANMNERVGGGHSSIEILTNTAIHGCRQAAEGFRLNLISGSNKFTRTVSSIIVAAPERREANFTLYGLRPSERVIPLSRMTQQAEAMIDDLSKTFKTGTVVFLTGLFNESNPVIAADVMQTARRLQTHSRPNGKPIQTYIFTKNLKVAADGLEKLYRETKQAGTVYIKLTDMDPEIVQKDEGVNIAFTDEVTGLPFRLTPDITVVDETILPPERSNDLAVVLGLDQDENGFAQADNVHRLPVFTNRNGIFIAGPSRGILAPNDRIEDAVNASLAAMEWIGAETVPTDDKASIDKGACVRCLTCYRFCPYQAICLDVYPAVMPEACERCGICAAECPQHAIDIKGLGQQQMTNRIGLPAPDLSSESFIPFIVAFCCRRSGSQAARLASLLGKDHPEGLKIVEVPCAGSLSYEHLFSGFRQGADGVIVFTCHEGNCHSQRGNTLAHSRIEHLKERLMRIGYDTERLEIQTLASNMGIEFAAGIRRFTQIIMGLGPSPLI